MKRTTFFALLPLIALVVGSITWGIQTMLASNTQSTRQQVVEEYVRKNINTLSPEKAVLGGTFYVTNISVDQYKGKVSYEDGHIAHSAEFTFEVRGKVVLITSFVIVST